MITAKLDASLDEGGLSTEFHADPESDMASIYQANMDARRDHVFLDLDTAEKLLVALDEWLTARGR